MGTGLFEILKLVSRRRTSPRSCPAHDSPPRELITLQAVRDVVVPERLRARIEPGYPLPRAEPQPAGAIFEKAHDVVGRQALAFGIAGEAVASAVITVEASSRAGVYDRPSRGLLPPAPSSRRSRWNHNDGGQ
jgi:hypothetical protein